MTKLAAEHLCTLNARTMGAHGLLRFFTVYGPRHARHGLHALLRAVGDGRETEELRELGTVRDCTDVDDVVGKANLQAWGTTREIGPSRPGASSNGRSGRQSRVNEVLASCSGRAPGGAVRVVRGVPVLGDVLRTGEDGGAQQATGWTPWVGRRGGLEEQYRWGAAGV